jgi:peptidoglycan-associated lipoprotein
MVRLRSYPEIIVIIAVLVLGVACAKRPVGIQSKTAGASVPAPTVVAPPPEPPATPQEPSGGPTSPRSGVPLPVTPPSAGAGAGQRPSPSDFRASDALKDIYFDFDKHNIRPDAANTLMANAAWMKEHPGSSILIEGHCDERGTTEYNLALGQRRAQSTRDFLMAQGISGNRIAMISYGKERPSCTESTESCWARNRRAHFLVKPS